MMDNVARVAPTWTIRDAVFGIGPKLQERLELHRLGTVEQWCAAGAWDWTDIYGLGHRRVWRIDGALRAEGFTPPRDDF